MAALKDSHRTTTKKDRKNNKRKNSDWIVSIQDENGFKIGIVKKNNSLCKNYKGYCYNN